MFATRQCNNPRAGKDGPGSWSPPARASGGGSGRRPAHPDAHAGTRRRDAHVIGQAGDHGQPESGGDRGVVGTVDHGRAGGRGGLRARADAVAVGARRGRVGRGGARGGVVTHHDDEPLALVRHLDLDRLGRAVPLVRLDRARARLAHGQAHLVEQRFVHATTPRYRGRDQARGADVRGQRREGDFYGGHGSDRFWSGRRYFSSFLAAMAPSTVSWMPNTLVSPVILKILSMRSCVQTRSREPSCARTRFRPPTSTPRPVESRNSTFSMLTTSW